MDKWNALSQNFCFKMIIVILIAALVAMGFFGIVWFDSTDDTMPTIDPSISVDSRPVVSGTNGDATNKSNSPKQGDYPVAVSGPLPKTDTAMPYFPWPPPEASGMNVIPAKLLREEISLRDVAETIQSALAFAGKHEIRYYYIPNGFAMVTRLESIDEQGNSLREVDRDKVNFLTYIRNLFWVPPGYYRMVVFIVTDQRFEAIGDPIDRDSAVSFLKRGFNDLPDIYADMIYSKRYRTTALIYEFLKDQQNKVARVITPGRLDAYSHLNKIGWYTAAERVAKTPGATLLFQRSIAIDSRYP